MFLQLTQNSSIKVEDLRKNTLKRFNTATQNPMYKSCFKNMMNLDQLVSIITPF